MKTDPGMEPSDKEGYQVSRSSVDKTYAKEI